jgi:hypothetical protein
MMPHEKGKTCGKHMGEERNSSFLWLENTKKRESLEDLGLEGRVILQ